MFKGFHGCIDRNAVANLLVGWWTLEREEEEEVINSSQRDSTVSQKCYLLVHYRYGNMSRRSRAVYLTIGNLVVFFCGKRRFEEEEEELNP